MSERKDRTYPRIDEESLDYEASKTLWDVGEIPSDIFINDALKQLLKTRHLIMNGTTTMQDISPDKFDYEMQRSPIITEVKRLGINGEKLGELYTSHFGKYFELLPRKKGKKARNAVKDRYSLQNINPDIYAINLWEFEELDEKLPESLPLHFYAASQSVGLYKKREEKVVFSGTKNAVYENIEDVKDATQVLLWLRYHELSSALKRYQVLSILRITEKTDFQFAFNDYDEVAAALSPYVYFRGWEERLKKINGSRDFTLPKPFRDTNVKQVLLSADFMYEDKGRSRPELLGRALRSIQETGKTNEIVEHYFRMQIEAITKGGTRPFKTWELKKLGIFDRVQEFTETIKPGIKIEEKVAPEPGNEDIIPEHAQPADTQVGKEAVNLPEPEIPQEEEVQHEPELGAEEISQPGTLHQESEPKEEPVSTASEPEKSKMDSTYRLKFPRSPRVQIREELSKKKIWSPTDFYIYTHTLVEGKKALLKSKSYPDSLNLSDPWVDAIQTVEGTLQFLLRRRIVFGIDSQDGKLKFSQLLPVRTPGRETILELENNEELLELQRFNPVIGDILRDSEGPYFFEEKPIIPMSALYNVLRDDSEIPITALSMGRRNSYLMLRTSDITSLTSSDERIISLEDFQRTWYERSGISVPNTRLGRWLSTDGVSVLSQNFNRRPAVIAACRSHKVVMYETDNNITYNRIA